MYIYRRTKNFFLLFLGSNLLLDTRKHQWFLTMWPILFYSIGRTSFFFFHFSFFPSSFSFKSSLASRNAFSLVWSRHRSSSRTTLVYIFFGFIYGGVFVFWSAGRSPLPVPPSPSLPWLSPESPFPWRASAVSPSCILWSDSCLSRCAPSCTMLCCAVFLWL